MNYNNRKFKPVSVSTNGQISSDIIFHYKQEQNVVTCSYEGGSIVKGQLLGIIGAGGDIEISYHQINKEGLIMTGRCSSKPEIMGNGKIRLIESWQWTSGDLSKGSSVLEEL